jgi:hypothetical protein
MFKRVRKELAKQHIEENEFDPNDDEEKLAGVFSDSETDSDDSDDEETRRLKKRARKELIKAINSGAKSSDEEEDSEEEDLEEEDDEEEEDNNDFENDEDNEDQEKEEEEEEEEEEEGETVEVYTCNICPDKELKNQKQVEIHLKSKLHRRREKFLKKTQPSKQVYNYRSVFISETHVLI